VPYFILHIHVHTLCDLCKNGYILLQQALNHLGLYLMRCAEMQFDCTNGIVLNHTAQNNSRTWYTFTNLHTTTRPSGIVNYTNKNLLHVRLMQSYGFFSMHCVSRVPTNVT
jgi:hypothetical protein